MSFSLAIFSSKQFMPLRLVKYQRLWLTEDITLIHDGGKTKPTGAVQAKGNTHLVVPADEERQIARDTGIVLKRRQQWLHNT